MKKKWKLLACVVLVLTLVLGCGIIAHAEDSSYTTVYYDVTYCQTEARSMLDMINTWKASDDAWYWDSTDTEKISAKTETGLVYDYGLEQIAMQRAADLVLLYSHTRPDNTTCWTAYTYSFRACGENIAAGYSSASSVFAAWQETDKNYSGQGHRRNMLSSGYTSVGIACVRY